MTTYVLVHGAWHGGWCWKKTAPLLRDAGADVFAPTLTGMGERAHLNDRIDPSEITLDVHIQDIVQLMRYEGLIPALESAHAFVTALQEAEHMSPHESILINQSGRGDKDIFTIAEALGDSRWRDFLRSKVLSWEEEP